MTSRPIHSHFSIYQFSTGRRIFAHRAVREVALAHNLTALVEHIDEAIAFDFKVHATEIAWRGGSATVEVQPRDIDAAIDRTHNAISAVLQQAVRTFPEGSQAAAQAQALLQNLYPQGVHNITRQRHVEQLIDNERTVGELSSPTWGELIKSLGLGLYLQQLRGLNKDFEALLQRTQNTSGRPTFEQVRTARIHGQTKLCITMAHIFVAFPKDGDQSTEIREALLAPIAQQNEIIASYLRRRRPVPEIDPDTGQAPSGEPEVDSETTFLSKDPPPEEPPQDPDMG